MKKSIVSTLRIGALLGALVTAAAIISARSAVADTSNNGRDLVGAFCGGLCISLSFDEATTSNNAPTDFDLRPGTYWLTVNDTNNFHNFALRYPDGTVETFTDVGGPNGAPGVVRVKLELREGSYRLLCTAPNHENLGMFVDFEVGGVGQLE